MFVYSFFFQNNTEVERQRRVFRVTACFARPSARCSGVSCDMKFESNIDCSSFDTGSNIGQNVSELPEKFKLRITP